MKFSGKVGNGPLNKRSNSAGDPDHRLDTGIVFRIHQSSLLGDTESADTNLLLTLIRQMAALVRRALAEVCTVLVLLVVQSALYPSIAIRHQFMC